MCFSSTGVAGIIQLQREKVSTQVCFQMSLQMCVLHGAIIALVARVRFQTVVRHDVSPHVPGVVRVVRTGVARVLVFESVGPVHERARPTVV